MSTPFVCQVTPHLIEVTAQDQDQAQDTATEFALDWIESAGSNSHRCYAVVKYEGRNEWSEHMYSVQCIDLTKEVIH